MFGSEETMSGILHSSRDSSLYSIGGGNDDSSVDEPKSGTREVEPGLENELYFSAKF